MSTTTSQPVAWMRRWHYTGEKEFKVRNEKTGRMKTHDKFMWLPVSVGKILADDVPLYAAPIPPTEEKKP